MRCRIVTKLGVRVSQPDYYHEYEEQLSLDRAILWAVSLEVPLPDCADTRTGRRTRGTE
jgi:hypothetical protein